MRSGLRPRNTIPRDLTLKEWGVLALVYRSGGILLLREISEITGESRRGVSRVLRGLRLKGRVTGAVGSEEVTWLRHNFSTKKLREDEQEEGGV